MQLETPNRSKALSVSELNRQVKSLLENSFLSIRVIGEISNFARPASGHWYFTLKDGGAQVRCAMFRGRNQNLNFRPKEGDQVVVTARVSLYEGRGDYQLICDRMEEDGIGRLQIAFEQLKRKLQAEGLFESSRKRSLPAHPQSLGIVTSETGAAIHDILTVLKRRYPGMSVYLYPTPVQGNEAIDGICRAIDLANRDNRVDVLIVGRGGGSLEDLWAFNEERVARAIIASAIPVVSAVGHEVDLSISDLVADQRAATPSAAAELLSPDQNELRESVRQRERSLIQRWQWALLRRQEQLDAISKRLRHPGEKIRDRVQRVDELEIRLKRAFDRLVERKSVQLDHLQKQLIQQRPDRRIKQEQINVQSLMQRLNKSIHNLIEMRKLSLAHQVNRLQDISPLATLERGYALVNDSQGQVVRNTDTLNPGDIVRVRVQHGSFRAQVNEITEADNGAS